MSPLRRLSPQPYVFISLSPTYSFMCDIEGHTKNLAEQMNEGRNQTERATPVLLPSSTPIITQTTSSVAPQEGPEVVIFQKHV